MTGAPLLSVVVSTIGRPREFRRLMESLEAAPLARSIELVLVDQSEAQSCIAVTAERDWTVPLVVATSGRGASLGRNTGLALSSAPVVLFPDDDAWYPAGTLEAVLDTFRRNPGIAAFCGRQTTGDGRDSMLRWRRQPGVVTARNFLTTSIMSTMFFRRDWLARVGPFDEQMGVGTSSWYGACEESDLLLRVIEAGGVVPYDPSVVVLQDEPRDEPTPEFVTKMLKYGCGQGHLWRKRSLPRGVLAYLLARKLVAATVRTARGDRLLARADLAWLRGNLAGYFDVAPRSLRGSRSPVAVGPS